MKYWLEMGYRHNSDKYRHNSDKYRHLRVFLLTLKLSAFFLIFLFFLTSKQIITGSKLGEKLFN